MRTITLISLLFTSSKLFAAERVKPLLGDQFGQVLALEVEFVDKSDSYFDQNIVKARWNAKVFNVDGKILDSPIVFEYRAEKDNFRKGVRYQLQGYEDIYSFGTPKAWEPMTQINYDIHRRVHLRVPQFLAAEKVPDITNSDAKTFKSHLGHTVSIQGRLSNGVQGACLFGAIPKGVSFYIIPVMPPTGGYTWPPEWNDYGKQVRVTGELKFRSFEKARSSNHGKSSDGVPPQIPPDYYYMEVQHTKLELLPSE